MIVYQLLFSDTMVSGFISGYHGEQDVHPIVPALHQGVQAILRMALVITQHDIA